MSENNHKVWCAANDWNGGKPCNCPARSELAEARGSAFRDQLEAMYAAIPWWKKVLICCVLNRKKWKLARAHNRVACSMLLTDNHELGEAVRAAGDKLWAEIYKMPNRELDSKNSV